MTTCTFCVANGGNTPSLTFDTEAAWLSHLVSNEHFSVQKQRGAKKTFENWDKKRTLIVSGVSGITAKELVEYFVKFGDIQNLFCTSLYNTGTPQFCKVLMAERKSAKAAHDHGQHMIRGKVFQVRLQIPPVTVGPQARPSKSNNEKLNLSVSSDISAVSNSSGPSKYQSGQWIETKRLLTKLQDKPEGGFSIVDGGYSCRTCEEFIGLGEERWVQHLVSERHQSVHKKCPALGHNLWDLDRVIEIDNKNGVMSEYLLRYIIAFGGIVVDYSYLSNKKSGYAKVASALMSTIDGVMKLTGSKSHHVGPNRAVVEINWIPFPKKMELLKKKKEILSLEIVIDPKANIAESAEKPNDDVPATIGNEKVVETVELKRPSQCEKSENMNVIKKNSEEEVSKKRKATESPPPLDLDLDVKPITNMDVFKDVPIEEQLEKCRQHFGWNGFFIDNAMAFVDQIVKAVNLKYSKIPFGDFTTGLGLQSRPVLHLLVDIPPDSKKAKVNSNTIKQQEIDRFLNMLTVLIEKKKVQFPVKKVWFVDSEVSVLSSVEKMNICLKLRFSNILPSQECKLFKFYCDLDPRILQFSFLLNLWASSNSILQSSKQVYPNQLLVLMIMFYLQHKKIIPTVQQLQEALPETADTKSYLIDGSNSSFCDDVKAMRSLHPNPLQAMLQDDRVRALSVVGLMKDWITFFASVDLKENALCTRFGYLIPKKDFQPDSVGQLPGDLCRVYRFGMTQLEKKNSTEGITTKKFLCAQTPLCIQNPFDLSVNASTGVSSAEVIRFQNCCKEAATVLKSIVTSDKVDLTDFLVQCVPLFNEVVEVEVEEKKCKKMKTASLEPFPIPLKQVPSSTEQVAGKSGNSACITEPGITKRQTASDFFDKNADTPEADVYETLIDVDDTDSDDGSDDDIGVSDEEMQEENEIMNEPIIQMAANKKRCTISLSKYLFDYFAISFAGKYRMKYNKIQILMLQFILDFNQKFWTKCLGLIFEPKVGQKFWPEGFIQFVGKGQKSNKTMLQKVLAISNSEKNIDVCFRVRNDGEIIHKMFRDSPENQTVKKWGAGKNLTDLSLQLYEEVPEERLQEIRNSVYTKSSGETILFECRLVGWVAGFLRGGSTSLASLNITHCQSPADNKMIVLLKALFRTLCMSYLNKMMKRWIYDAEDFDEKTVEKLVQTRRQKWIAKRNKRIRKKENRKKKLAIRYSRDHDDTQTRMSQQRPPNIHSESNNQQKPVVQPGQYEPVNYQGHGPPTRATGRDVGSFQNSSRIPYQQQFSSEPCSTGRLLRNPGPQGMQTFHSSQSHRDNLVLPNPLSHNVRRSVSQAYPSSANKYQSEMFQSTGVYNLPNPNFDQDHQQASRQMPSSLSQRPSVAYQPPKLLPNPLARTREPVDRVRENDNTGWTSGQDRYVDDNLHTNPSQLYCGPKREYPKETSLPNQQHSSELNSRRTAYNETMHLFRNPQLNSLQFGGYSRVPSAPKQSCQYGLSRPSDPMKRGFITGGFLSTTEKFECEDENLEIVYDTDPRSANSPTPTPLQNYKVGAAFPVPGRSDDRPANRAAPRNLPSFVNERISSMPQPTSSYTLNSGYYGGTSNVNYPTNREQSCDNSAQELFVSPDDFRGFGINPSGGYVDYGLGRGYGRRF